MNTKRKTSLCNVSDLTILSGWKIFTAVLSVLSKKTIFHIAGAFHQSFFHKSTILAYHFSFLHPGDPTWNKYVSKWMDSDTDC